MIVYIKIGVEQFNRIKPNEIGRKSKANKTVLVVFIHILFVQGK